MGLGSLEENMTPLNWVEKPELLGLTMEDFQGSLSLSLHPLVTSREVPYTQLLKVGKPEPGSWMSRPAVFAESENSLLSHLIPTEGWF